MRHGSSEPPAAEATELFISDEKSTFLEAAQMVEMGGGAVT